MQVKPARCCCPTMDSHLDRKCGQHVNPDDCPDCIIRYYPGSGDFGIPVHDGGTSYIRIEFCPWCGQRLDPT